MLELNVSNVPHATASDDGLTLTIIFDLEDGGQARMHIPTVSTTGGFKRCRS